MPTTLRRDSAIALLALFAIAGSVGAQFAHASLSIQDAFLLVALAFGGSILVVGLLRQAIKGEFGSDLLAGISIVTSLCLHQYLAGTIVVLMLSGGQTLEAYASARASSVLQALANRMPSVAHLVHENELRDAAIENLIVGDIVAIFPHEICPVDGIVVGGNGGMDESYLTGEPYAIMKAPGAVAFSGAINGESALRVQVTALAVDSRYAKIMEVMRESSQRRPQLRRIADQLGAIYTPVALTIAVVAWIASADPMRFLAVLVIATPCPLLIAIPVAIIGSISLAAKRGIIIKDPAVLEKVDQCRVAIFDKTGTLTYGRPSLTEILPGPGHTEAEVLALVASLERYSKHPLASAILELAQQRGSQHLETLSVSEQPGKGLHGSVGGHNVEITSRKKLSESSPQLVDQLPEMASGMECVVLIDESYGGTLRFRDEPREDGLNFVRHLRARHHFSRVVMLSGDRESEVRHLASKVGIKEVYFSQTPEQKLELVREATRAGETIFVGDGINDAPALTASTVGVAFGIGNDITGAAAGAVIMESTLEKVDELMHIGRRMRRIALQSAYGGMGLSVLGMFLAATGHLTPVVGAISQEVIDAAAVLNALRASLRPGSLTDY